MWTAFPVSRSVVRNVGNLITLKATKTDVVRRQWAELRDPSLRTAENTDFEPADPSWNPACCTAEPRWINPLDRAGPVLQRLTNRP